MLTFTFSLRMARMHRLSTDILSPLHSDISLNDVSAFSFESLSATPEFDKNIASPIFNDIEKDSDVDLLCTRTMKESTTAFDVITNDIKKQSKKNIERAEILKESCDILKQSMDNMFDAKASYPSFASPVLKNAKLKNVNQALKTHSKINAVKVVESSQVLKVHKKLMSCDLEDNVIISEKKYKQNPLTCKEKKTHDQSKSPRLSKEATENIKVKSKIQVIGSTDTKRSNTALAEEQETDSFKSLTKQGKEKGAKPRNLSKKREEKEAGNAKKFYFQSQRKIPISSNTSTTEQKEISIEKAIELTIGREMIDLRRFILQYNANMQKELLKVQETAKNQNKVTSYLFSVIDDLLETNKKLISKHGVF